MGATSGIGSGAAGPWYRVQAILADGRQGASAERDYASVLPAALNAAMHRRPFIAGWLSRGGGAPLELITNAGPLPEPGAPDRQAQAARLQSRPHTRREFGESSRAIDPSALFDEQDDLDSSVVIESSRIIGPGGVIEPSRVIEPGRPLGSGPAGGAGVIAEPSRSAGGALETMDAIEPSSLFEPKELLFPWGARGVPMPGSLLTDLDRLLWAPCPGRQAPPLGWDTPQLTVQAAVGYLGAREGRRAGDDAGRRQTLFESALVTLMARPFGWLVVAEPSELIDTEIAELDAFREAGLWNVRVLAGAATEQELRLIAPVLVGSVDLAAHPYRLRSPEEPRDLADALASKLADPVDGAQVPFAATAGALAALTGLPRGEVPGVRVLDPTSFDVTSETMSEAVSALSAEMSADGDPRGEAAIDLGAILDGQDRRVGTFRVPFGTLNRHAFITGATGSGKSQTVRHMLEQLTGAGIPWLAVEPVKSEYAAMAGRIAENGHITVINPSDPAAVPLSVNPLEPEPGYPVQAHIDMVRALFLAAFDAREPFPQIISQALQRAYEDCGWDPVTGAGRPGARAAPAGPTLAQLQRAALGVIEDVGYGRELQADVRGFVDVRLRSLRTGSAGRFFEGGHPADIAELLRRNVVLAIEDVANDEDKAFLIGTLIIRLVEHLRMRARRERLSGLRHIIVIEEAHRLLRNRGAEGSSSHA